MLNHCLLTTRNTRFSLIALCMLLIGKILCAQKPASDILCGAERLEQYLPLIQNKKVAMMVNATSRIGSTHLVDSLYQAGVRIQRIFAPEHGYKGQADAGEKVQSGRDAQYGWEIVSLYGTNKEPAQEHIRDIDWVIFDIQDVGARFYTYISSLQYLMEACATWDKPLLILDRPNPNGFYVDGPTLVPEQKSFVGMQAVPLVHGMTVGEYARMINEEGWLKNAKPCRLTVIPCEGYMHHQTYAPPIPPSPNLKTLQAILWYPSLCLFEGTDISVGRGTPAPFTCWGHPDFPDSLYAFIPRSMPGAKNPPHLQKTCYGENLNIPIEELLENHPGQITLAPLLKAYSLSGKGPAFFTPFFDKLAGNSQLRQQIIAGLSEAQIRESWKSEIEKFKLLRQKYLLYPEN